MSPQGWVGRKHIMYALCLTKMSWWTMGPWVTHTPTTTIPTNSQVFLLLYLWGQRRAVGSKPETSKWLESSESLEPKWSIPIINPTFLCMYGYLRYVYIILIKCIHIYVYIHTNMCYLYISMKWSKGRCADICYRSVPWMVWEWRVWNSHHQEWLRDISLPNFENLLKSR